MFNLELLNIHQNNTPARISHLRSVYARKKDETSAEGGCRQSNDDDDSARERQFAGTGRKKPHLPAEAPSDSPNTPGKDRLRRAVHALNAASKDYGRRSKIQDDEWKAALQIKTDTSLL